MVELDTPSREATARMDIPIAYSFTASDCNASGDQAVRGANVPGRLVNPGFGDAAA
jgi:hypothetical protein